jgi:UDP-2,3-diacylglucosamine hydrolase
VLDFISDLHLKFTDGATFEAWKRYLAETPADALFILGDLFEVWVGDDAAGGPGFEQDCARILSAAGRRCAVHFMPGNRDFLLGKQFLNASGMSGLDDPTVLAFAGQRWLLSHGDALCLDDAPYQHFRRMVRDPIWQRDVLARPLDERRALARHIREQGTRSANNDAHDYADVDPDMGRQWLQAAQAVTLIHGHTHRPGEHDLGTVAHNGCNGREEAARLRRIVLSDWDAGASPPRAQVLRMTDAGLRRVDLAA